MRPSEWARERIAMWESEARSAILNTVPNPGQAAIALARSAEAAVIAAYLEEMEVKG